MNLPEPLAELLRPLLSVLPLQEAMEQLVVTGRVKNTHVSLVDQITADAIIQNQRELAAGLWLYIDQLDRSHRISQQIDTPTGSFWHAIIHRREGDFPNSKHWYRCTGQHPALSWIEAAGGFDPPGFVDRVEQCDLSGGRDVELVDLQRREWVALFEWCAQE